MFYAHFVLSKRGPLAKIWLAAHWEKKLTKAQVYETNIDSTVDAILEPKVKLALRTSGHLLLGVVRIYSRKTKYLLADCNEAFVKIKMAFRPGIVDLPDDNREAAVGSITLEENFDDFDANFNDFEMDAMDASSKFAVNQSRPEEITIREDVGHVNFITDDGFGDVGFDDRELMREASSIEDSLFKTPAPFGDVSNIANTSKVTSDVLEDAAPLDLINDGFGDDGLDTDLLDGPGLFEDVPMDPPDLSNIEAPPLDDTITDLPPPDVSAVDVVSSLATTGQPTMSETTLLPDEDRAFALEPLETTSMISGYTGVSVDKRPKRRRKLLVDDQKGIDSQSMKEQLVQTNDIVTTLDLAPPNRQLMQWKEQGVVEKLFSQPSRNIIHRSLHKLFTRNLSIVISASEPDEDRHKKRSRSPEPEQERAEENFPNEPSGVDLAADVTAVEQVEDMNNTLINEPVEMPEEPLAQEDGQITEETPRKKLRTSGKANRAEEVDSADEDVEAPMLDDQTTLEPESALLAEEQTGNELEDKLLNRRTAAMLVSLRKQNKREPGEPISLIDMCKRGHSRKLAAAKFYTCLVLQKHQVVSMEQDEPFTDIMITPGPNFERQL